MQLSELLREVLERKASDLHLVVGQPPVFRVDGHLIRREGPVLDAEAVESLILPHLKERHRTALQDQQDILTVLRHGGISLRFHVFRAQGSLAAAFRVIPMRVPVIADLGFDSETASLLSKIIRITRGLIVVTGPTGSGKTTTCVALLEEINRSRAERIITIEDPVEYVFEGKQSLISQRMVGEDVPSVMYGLRSASREDPDIILIGEIRDLETMHIALALADTGHLVFTMLHVDSASEAVKRIIEAFPEAQQGVIQRLLARNLQAVIAQRLFPRHGKPGRVPGCEILIATPQVRQRIQQGKTDLTSVIEAGREIGMQTMDDALEKLYEAGTISYEMAVFNMEDKERLKRRPEDGTGPPSSDSPDDSGATMSPPPHTT